MKMNKVTSVEDYKIVSSFQSLRKTLLDDKFADRLEKPLAYWALPNDRRLPLAFLGRTIKDLLATPFEELSATPGIGQKKISSLVKLLSRATKDHPPAVPFGLTELNEKKSTMVEKPRRQGTTFDPSMKEIGGSLFIANSLSALSDLSFSVTLTEAAKDSRSSLTSRGYFPAELRP
jgi:hypothetical protein